MKKSTLFCNGFLSSSSSPARIFMMIALSFAFTVSLSAQSPKISIQGTLKSANGISVPDDQYHVRFSLYNVPTGGTALWHEDTTVDVIGSIYSHYLGSVTPLNPADFASTLYLGVKVGNYELIPRTELAYAPYSFSVANAQVAQVAQKVLCSGALGDVKYSILDPTQFALQNGACWVPMDGRALAATDQLRIATGMTSIPDGSGLFLRSQEFNGGADNDPDRTSATDIATVQGDATAIHYHNMYHSHGVTDPGHSHGIVGYHEVGTASGVDKQAVSSKDGVMDYPYPGKMDRIYSAPTGISVNEYVGYTQGNTGQVANETRPKNLNLWVYIRIN